MSFKRIIGNREQLLSHGNVEGRRVVLEASEYALNQALPHKHTRNLVSVIQGKLFVGYLSFDLSEVKDIYVIGAGKGSFQIAQALEGSLEDRVSEGLMIVKRGDKGRLRKIEVVEAGHPIPDEDGLKGAQRIVEIARKARQGDIVFCVLTGGCSALMPLPAEGISLEDKKILTNLLLKKGAAIQEINAVRKHISAIKGGRLLEYIKDGKVITLTISTSPEGMPWPDPVLPDPSTFHDAISILKKYKLWESTPPSIRGHLKKGLSNPDLETPKSFKGIEHHIFSVLKKEEVYDAARKRAEELGFNSILLSTTLEGESKEVAKVLAGIAKEVARFSRPFRPPCVLVLGGETTVNTEGKGGRGGPSQELTLAFSLRLGKNDNIVIADIDTDGTDGPTDIAGGIADNFTLERAKEKGLDARISLENHDSSAILTELEDAIITGHTGTNVMDLIVIAVGL